MDEKIFLLRAWYANPVRTLVFEGDFATIKQVRAACVLLCLRFPFLEFSLTSDEGTLASGVDGYEDNPADKRPSFFDKLDELK